VRSGAEIDAVLRVVDAEPVRDRAVEKDKDSDCELVTETLRLAVTVNENVWEAEPLWSWLVVSVGSLAESDAEDDRAKDNE
jgi:hypothetical protein